MLVISVLTNRHLFLQHTMVKTGLELIMTSYFMQEPASKVGFRWKYLRIVIPYFVLLTIWAKEPELIYLGVISPDRWLVWKKRRWALGVRAGARLSLQPMWPQDGF